MTLEGTIERLVFVSEDKGFTVARLKPSRGRRLVTVVGTMPGVKVGESLRLEGEWSTHARFGRQFKIDSFEVALPADMDGLKKYLGSGLIKGVGPATAERIVDHFGLATLDVIEQRPDRLREIEGLGAKRIRAIAASWAEHKGLKEIIFFLQEHNISASLALRVYKEFGEPAPRIIKNQPYNLARIPGIGFPLADKIALSAGFSSYSLHRLKAAVYHVLTQASEDGHVYLPLPEVRAKVGDFLPQASQETMQMALLDLAREGDVKAEVVEGAQAVYLSELHRAETSVARQLRAILGSGTDRLKSLKPLDWEGALSSVSKEEGLQLTPEQKTAITAAVTAKVAVLTGGPGTGKTTTIRSIVRLLHQQGCSVLLAAPTGRAAKRLTEIAGSPAKTIHRLLELRPGEHAGYGLENPLDADIVIIDEASMLDLPLTNALLKALPLSTHLLLVGDIDQLPPVGVGYVLRDIIESGIAPVVRLGLIFRQAEGSDIITNAHRINAGELPVLANGRGQFAFLADDNLESCAELVVDLARRRIPQKLGLDPFDDVQVLSPVHRGVGGVEWLNTQLQQALNPADGRRAEKRFGSRVFREGDKVMQLRNDYDKGVFNGDLGKIVSLDLTNEMAYIRFDDWTPVAYAFSEMDEIIHAYAISVHKSQGSDYPVVVMPLLTQHYTMLQRNLIYTAVTRATKLVVLVGSRKALATAVGNDHSARRYTGLRVRLAS